ncbi:phosphotransferase family enzyme [Ilumatobacter fluminis]|uniref:Phosphotransferase family enzyme n=1 Tax=Ilumatobacter fluminis TaxID=467091 RepID=A0A4R7HZL3_9ACTN|nr:phosphotransferase [Ilumatobacter fluminis]TDT15613.1 phosphotransferase family enzyme [Ilumatobacter fluminis]
MDDPPGPLLASGRSADIYDVGGGRVLRRRRVGTIGDHEVIAMRVARDAGVPAPRVFDVDGADLLMERVVGRTMIDELGRRPWAAGRFGRELARLHLALRMVAAPDGLRGDGPVLVHNDLHPGNVVVTADGPVVIDWESAEAGPPDRDAAQMWLLGEIAEVDDLAPWLRPVVGAVRGRMLTSFLESAGRPTRETVAAVCADRLMDRNTRVSEQDAIRSFAQRHG